MTPAEWKEAEDLVHGVVPVLKEIEAPTDVDMATDITMDVRDSMDSVRRDILSKAYATGPIAPHVGAQKKSIPRCQ